MTERLLVVDLAATSKNWALTPEGEERLRRDAPPGWRIHVVGAPTSSDGDGPPRPSDEVMNAIQGAEIYYGFGIPRLLFLEAKKLEWVHSSAAGVVTSLHPEMIASDVKFTNSAGIHAVPIAEYIVAGVLHFLRGLDYAVDQKQRVEWNKQPFVKLDSLLREMDTVRALIIGVGGLGGAAGERLTALGARCTGVRRRVGLGAPAGFERVVALDQIDAELPNHDVIVLAAPLTPETNGLLTKERLDLLPPNSIIVNVARGAMVDDDALVERLESGRIRGAVLDVFRAEPLAAESPYWRLPNVLLTPHTSPVSPGRFWPRQLDLFLDNWSRYLRGEPLRNVVDKHAGY
jgi:phosphoglycerate dehydrogenase-like enzyme